MNGSVIYYGVEHGKSRIEGWGGVHFQPAKLEIPRKHSNGDVKKTFKISESTI